MDDPACGCLLCRKEWEKSGSHSPFATSDSDWLLQNKSPIGEPPLVPLTEEGAGTNKSQVTPNIQNTVSCLRVCICICSCVCAYVYICDRVWIPLASLVSHRVLNYLMEALIELQTLMIVSLDEGD